MLTDNPAESLNHRLKDRHILKKNGGKQLRRIQLILSSESHMHAISPSHMYNTYKHTCSLRNKRRDDGKKRWKNEYFIYMKKMEAEIIFELVKNLKFNMQILSIHYVNY